MEQKEIYRFNTSDDMGYLLLKQALRLTDEDIYNNIALHFELMQEQLKQKGILYKNLKSALVPNQDKNRNEICFIFDAEKVRMGFYGIHIFQKIIPLLDKESTYSILCGDYTGEIKETNEFVFYNYPDYYNWLRNTYYGDFFLVYFNRLTKKQCLEIVTGLLQYSWFLGYIDVTYHSAFKSYISSILCNVCIKNKNKIILPHPEDYLDEENVNIWDYPFEENNFKCVSINERIFNVFLSYKIETLIVDDMDIGFSFNALFPKFESITQIMLKIDDNKWYKYLTDKDKGKGAILEKVGYSPNQKDKFIREVYDKICNNYLYNLRQNEYGDLLFNVCIELQTEDKHIRKTTVALKYIPENGEMYIITIT